MPHWAVLALRLQVGLVYVFAGIAKLQADWLLRAEPLATWLPARAGLPVVGSLLDERWLAFAASWGAAAFDLTLPFLLLWRRARPFAWAAAAVFHVATAALFEIGMFPWIMLGATLVFFTGAELRRMAARLRGSRRAPRQVVFAGTSRPLATLAAAALALFFAVQLLLPLRHWLYPGDVLWTEEGFRQSWRVMVVEKTGHVTFRVKPPGEATRSVFPSAYLTQLQELQMSYQPDMILELAHHIAHEYGPGTEVRAEALVSLNGRRSQALVDPAVDLAVQPSSLAHKGWLLPSPRHSEGSGHPAHVRACRQHDRDDPHPQCARSSPPNAEGTGSTSGPLALRVPHP